MTISKECCEKIKEFEGLRLTAYKCPGGSWTIGYGHTDGVLEGDHITKETADDIFLKDIGYFERTVYEIMHDDYQYELTQNQFDSLVSFTFNLGPGNLRKLTDNGNRSVSEIADAIPLYNKAAGRVLQGLVTRREWEAAHFLEGQPAYEYYEEVNPDQMTLDQILRAAGVEEAYTGDWKKRIPLAEGNGICNYTGTLRQNMVLREKALNGSLRKV